MKKIKMNLQNNYIIDNPFRKTGKLWLAFSILAIGIGITILLMTKSDFRLASREPSVINIFVWRFLAKLSSATLMIAMGIKYLKVALSVLFQYDPEKRLVENLAKEVNEKKDKFYYAYSANSLFRLMQSRVLDLVRPTSLVENITAKIFQGLKRLPPRYFTTSQNYLDAAMSAVSPILLTGFCLFLDYLEIIDLFGGNKIQWIAFLASVSVLFSWTPFSPMDHGKKNQKLIILFLCTFGIFLIVRTSSFVSELPAISNTVFLLIGLFISLSVFVFIAFFFFLKRRIEIEPTHDNVTVMTEDMDIDLHPEEIHRIIVRKMIEAGSENLINRIYEDEYASDNNSFKMSIIHETQPLPRHNIKDATLNHYADMLTIAGLISGCTGLVLILLLVSISSTFIGLLLGIVTGFGIVNFGLKLVGLSNLFLSEFLFESGIISLVANGEFKNARITAGRSVNDNVESKNNITRSSLSLQVACARITSVSFMQLGKSNPFENAPRYVVSMEQDDNTVEYLIKSLSNHMLSKSQIVGVSNIFDKNKIKDLNKIDKNDRGPGLLDS